MLGKILYRLFALFGMTLTCVACYGVPEAEYRPDFRTSGRVVDSDGRPIEGIQVRSDVGETTHSDKDGEFSISSPGYNGYIELTDVDGATNGEYADKLVVIEYRGDNYDLGDIVLNEKQ